MPPLSTKPVAVLIIGRPSEVRWEEEEEGEGMSRTGMIEVVSSASVVVKKGLLCFLMACYAATATLCIDQAHRAWSACLLSYARNETNFGSNGSLLEALPIVSYGLIQSYV